MAHVYSQSYLDGDDGGGVGRDGSGDDGGDASGDARGDYVRFATLVEGEYWWCGVTVSVGDIVWGWVQMVEC